MEAGLPSQGAPIVPDAFSGPRSTTHRASRVCTLVMYARLHEPDTERTTCITASTDSASTPSDSLR